MRVSFISPFLTSSLALWVVTFCVPAVATVIHSAVFNDFKSPRNVIVLDRANKTEFESYNWDKISLLALSDAKVANSGIVKEAHGHRVNVILVADVMKEFKTCDITDKKCRGSWISSKVNLLYKTEMEGLLLKIAPNSLNSTYQDAVVSLINEISNTFWDADLDYVTVWLPSNTNGDFLQRIVSYTNWIAVQIQQDPLKSQSSPLCKAVPLFPLDQALMDISQLISVLKIPATKIMPVYPWRGIEYDCQDMVGSDCLIHCPSPNQGLIDEDADIPADVIEDIITQMNLIPDLDIEQQSFYIRLDVDQQKLQVYFDTYITLLTKYELVESFGLGGLVVWSASDVTYSSNSYNQLMFAMRMWEALPSLE